MELIAAVIGIFAICFLLVYIIFHLDGEHFLLKLLLFLILLVCLPLIPKLLVQNADNCEFLINYTKDTYKYGVNLSGYHFDDYGVPPAFKRDIDDAKDALVFHNNRTYYYAEYCTTQSTTTYDTLMKTTVWIWVLSITYMIIYLIWVVLKFTGAVVPTDANKMGWRLKR